MAVQTKVIGPISAYAIAVQGGYTGTKAQWAQEIANAQTNAQLAQEAANTVETLTGTLPSDFNAILADFAPAYSASSTYAVGDYVFRSGQLYQCNTAITTAEAWTAAHWTAVTVGGELSELSGEINNIDGLFETVQTTVTETSNSGYYWNYTNGELVSSANYTAWQFSADEYTDYILQGLVVGTNNSGAVLFLDSNENILSYINDGTQASGHKFYITTPSNCSIVRYSTYTHSTWDATAIKVSNVPLSDYSSRISTNATNISANADAISALEDCTASVLPSYYADYIDEKVETIKSNAPLNGVTFAFITDEHWASNKKYSLQLLQHIRKNTSMNIIVSGGDYTRAYGDQDDIENAKNITLKYAKTLYPDWFSVRGNHDFTIKTSSSVASGITENDTATYHAIVRPSADWRYEVPTPDIDFISSDDKIYKNYCWVLTNEQAKVKIIGFCDFNVTDTSTYYGVSQYNSNPYVAYFAQLLKSCDGYTIVLVTHQAQTSQLNGGSNSTRLQNIAAAFVARTTISYGYEFDFTDCTGVLACWLSGHSHVDQSIAIDGVLHIGTTCDALYQDDGYGRTAGTVTEQAFDVFNIDTDNHTIKATRIGGGYDRAWNYQTGAVIT